MTSSPPPWLDGHLDLAYMALDRHPETLRLDAEEDPRKAAITLPSLSRGHVRCCLATLFTAAHEPEDPCGYLDHEDREGAHRAGMRQLELYESWEREGMVQIIRNRTALEACMNSEAGPLGIILLMECADPIRSPEEVELWRTRGVRMVGLSWAHGSRYSGGNQRAGGLSPEGRELVSALDESGVAHDASHLSDDSLDDLLVHARGPIASSHSNARQLLPDGPGAIRHLRSDHAEAIAKRGGIAGVNLYGRFLTKKGRAVLQDVIDHIHSLAEVFGREGVGLGSDADGGFTPDELPQELERPEEYPHICRSLAEDGWTEDELESFRTGAWLRFLRGIPAMT